MDKVAFIAWVTGSGDDNRLIMMPVSYENKLLSLFSSPFFFFLLVWSTAAVLLSGPRWLKFSQKRKYTFIFPSVHNLRRSAGLFLFSGLLGFTSGMDLEKKKKKKNSGKLGKPGQIITCLQLEAIWLCSFHTFVLSESQDVQKQMWGSTINMPCVSFSDSFHDKFCWGH